MTNAIQHLPALIASASTSDSAAREAWWRLRVLPTKGALEMHMKNHAKEKGQDFSLAGKGKEREGVGEGGCCFRGIE